MFLAKKLNRGAGTPAAPADAQFNYVAMLLHGDGTNGAQNNTFLDSSTNNFTITRNGNTTQGSFSPYGSNWSNFFDGSGDYFTSTGVNLSTGDVTFEFWIYPSDETVTYRCVYDTRIAGGSATSGFGVFQYGKVIEVYQSSLVVSSAANSIAINAWNHVALVRNSGTCQLYVNGVASGSSNSNTTNLNSTERRIANASTATYYYFGYISNLREVTSALYTGTFTPSTTPLTAISGTSLLTCQSNRFIDNSTNAFAITVNGNPSVQRFNPFGASTAYSTSVIGGSGYFDGSGDNLSVASNAAFGYGSGNFTIEMWFNCQGNISSTPYLLDCRSTSTASELVPTLYVDSSSYLTYWVNGSERIIASTAISIGSWNHVAVVRNSTTTTMYLNGTSVGTWSDSTTYATTAVIIGQRKDTASQSWLGNISNFRLVKGTAVYTANFTPSTTPLTAISGTSLLTSMTNGAIFDNAMMNDLETVGNAQISTSVKKYGTGSLAFDGTGDYLVAPQSVITDLGGGNFTLEFWVYFNSIGSEITFAAKTGSGANYGWFIQLVSGNFRLNIGNNGSIGTSRTFAWSPSTGQWYHAAVSRSSGSLRAFINGTQIGSTVTETNNGTSTALTGIGINLDGAYQALNGYIDDLRITKGYARYTTTFTPPTSALSDTGPY